MTVAEIMEAVKGLKVLELKKFVKTITKSLENRIRIQQPGLFGTMLIFGPKNPAIAIIVRVVHSLHLNNF